MYPLLFMSITQKRGHFYGCKSIRFRYIKTPAPFVSPFDKNRWIHALIKGTNQGWNVAIGIGESLLSRVIKWKSCPQVIYMASKCNDEWYAQVDLPRLKASLKPRWVEINPRDYAE